MIKKVHFKNFTCFKDCEISFANGLNVLTGESSTGKSAVLKAIYSLLRAKVSEHDAWLEKLSPKYQSEHIGGMACTYLECAFRCDGVSHLVSHLAKTGEHSEIALNFTDAKSDLSVDFYFRSHGRVHLSKMPARFDKKSPFFFPRGDGLVLLPENQKYTSPDISHDDFNCMLFRYAKTIVGDPNFKPFTNSPKGKQLYELYNLLISTLDGEIYSRDYRNFNIRPRSKKQSCMLKKPLELSLLSDGLRKFAYLVPLIKNGTLSNTDYFFWDNPEIYLDAEHLKVLAQVLLILAKAGMQIFIATQSLFLIRKINALLNTPLYEKLDSNFISLKHMYSSDVDGQDKTTDSSNSKDPVYIGVDAKCVDSIEGLGDFLLKDAELKNSCPSYPDDCECHGFDAKDLHLDGRKSKGG